MATVRNVPSSKRNILPKLASQMRVAFSSMAWNTGSSSPGDALMTRSTSDGRRLLLQQTPLQFIEQPRVLDGDDGLGGEVLHQLDLLVGERADFLAVNARWRRSVRSSLSIGTSIVVRAPPYLAAAPVWLRQLIPNGRPFWSQTSSEVGRASG